MKKTKEIFSKDATYQKFEVLKTNRNKRHRYQEFIIEGVRNINQATDHGWQINSFIYERDHKLSGWARELLTITPTLINYSLSNSLMMELSGKADPSELLAIVSMQPPEAGKLSDVPVIALFDRPSNKGNLGTLLRSCDALGVEQLIITGHSIDIYDPEVIGASMGSFFKVPFLKLSDNRDIDEYINELRNRYPKLIVIGTAEDSGQAIYQLDLISPLLIMIGNEKDGLNRHLQEACDVLAEIPMVKHRAASSLNVSCAATAVFYEIGRQRHIQNRTKD